jgi:hypothetical protein
VPKKPRRLLIDELSLTSLRKPSARPLVEPAEAVAVALSIAQPGPARLVSPEGPMVRTVLLAIKLAGYKIEPR